MKKLFSKYELMFIVIIFLTVIITFYYLYL